MNDIKHTYDHEYGDLSMCTYVHIRVLIEYYVYINSS
jgi:hypothetical protein